MQVRFFLQVMLGLHYIFQSPCEILNGSMRYQFSGFPNYFVQASLLSFTVCLDLCHPDINTRVSGVFFSQNDNCYFYEW